LGTRRRIKLESNLILNDIILYATDLFVCLSARWWTGRRWTDVAVAAVDGVVGTTTAGGR